MSVSKKDSKKNSKTPVIRFSLSNNTIDDKKLGSPRGSTEDSSKAKSFQTKNADNIDLPLQKGPTKTDLKKSNEFDPNNKENVDLKLFGNFFKRYK